MGIKAVLIGGILAMIVLGIVTRNTGYIYLAVVMLIIGAGIR